MPAYPELRERDLKEAERFMDMLRRQEGRFESMRGSKPLPRDDAAHFMDEKNYDQMLREGALALPISRGVFDNALAAGRPSTAELADVDAVRQGSRSPIVMGEMAALDRYGVDPAIVGRPLPKHPDPAVNRALELAGSGFREDKAYGFQRFPDAADNQRPSPLPPTLQEQPSWTREPMSPDDVRNFVQPYTPDEEWT